MRKIDEQFEVRRGGGPSPIELDAALEAMGHEPIGEVRPASPPLRRILIMVDLAAIGLGWLAAFLVAFLFGDVIFGPITALAQVVLIGTAGGFLLSAAGLYRRSICAIRSQELARIARVSLALAATTAVVLASVGREAAILASLAGALVWFAALAMERGLFREWIQGRRASGDFGAPVVVVGGKASSTAETAQFLIDNPVLGFVVLGILAPESDTWDQDIALLGDPEDLLPHLTRLRASGVVLDSSSMTGEELTAVMQSIGHTALHVHVSSGLRGIERRRITVAPMADETFLHVAPLGLTRLQLKAKRLVDVSLGSLALVLASPILGLAMVGIWLTDRGPVFFRQKRVGLNGEHFTLFKLRTMVVDAEARRADLEQDNSRSGPLFKVARDPRITPIGRFLRASSLDEVPQLLNVLEGTMSLVGPRPALPDEVAQFDDRLNERLRVKPGVTGLWQVEARDLPSFDLYRRYDLLYVQNWSVGLDLTIIARTVIVVGMRAVTAVLPFRGRSSASVLD